MPTTSFDAFRLELLSIRGAAGATPGKTLREGRLLERIRFLYIAWMTSVKPMLDATVANKRQVYKLQAELERIAQLTSKFKPTGEYIRRINRAITLSNQIVLVLPPSRVVAVQPAPYQRQDLFLPDIPDLPTMNVPNSIVGWRENMRLFLQDYPFDRSVFLMIRYRKRNRNLISILKKELSNAGMNCILASEHSITDDLYNPIACLMACSRGIAVFDAPETNQDFNPNVAYELGMLHLLGRKCLILKHSSLETLHTDILMKLYVPFRTVTNARQQVREWLATTG